MAGPPPPTTADFDSLLDSINGVSPFAFKGDERNRQRFLDAARKLMGKLETPREKMMRICTMQPLTVTFLKIALDINLFVHLNPGSDPVAFDPAHKGKTLQELATLTKTDPKLLKRILNFLCAQMLVFEVPAQKDGGDVLYAPTLTTRTLAHPKGHSVPEFHFLVNSHIFDGMPEYFKSIGYKNPNSLNESAFHYALEKGEGKSYWDWVEEREDVRRSFQEMMTYFAQPDVLAQQNGTNGPAKSAPVRTPVLTQVMKDLLAQGGSQAGKDGPTVVDVGGGTGHDCINLRIHAPEVQGRLVLQDMPNVTASAKTKLEENNIEVVPHNFFNPQPENCHGSFIYHLGSVLHDWPDKECLEILKHVRAAMRPGHSHLVLHECIMPETGATFKQIMPDIMMMCNFSAGERTLAEFDALLGNVGLKVENWWPDPKETRSVLLVKCI